MRRSALTILSAALLLTLTFAPLAKAGDLSCSMVAHQLSRTLFTNSGSHTTDGPAAQLIPECSTGVADGVRIYGGLFVIVPEEGTSDREVDTRAGVRVNVGTFKVDASIANYFVTDHRSINNTGEARVILSRPTEYKGFTIEPGITFDFQQALYGSRPDSLGIAAAVTISGTLDTWGAPMIWTKVEAWEYPFNNMTHHTGDPILAATAALLYPVEVMGRKFALGPILILTRGSVQGDDKLRYSFGLQANMFF